MKRIIFCFLILSVAYAKGQEKKCFYKGTNAINAGFGIGVDRNYTYYYRLDFPVLGGTYEYGLIKAGPGILGIGASVNSIISTNRYYSQVFFGGGLRVSYHPNFCNKNNIDAYAAAQLNIHPGYRSAFYPCVLIGAR